MTRFEELSDIIDKNKHSKKKVEEELEVSGLESNPLAAWGDEEIDPDLIDQLYKTPRSRPLQGENADRWD